MLFQRDIHHIQKETNVEWLFFLEFVDTDCIFVFAAFVQQCVTMQLCEVLFSIYQCI